MKIAIVGPSPVPFSLGGVESLLWGLTGWLNENTPHNVELIKLPSRENDFWDIIDSYKKFSELDLSYFDMIISTKYPAWMVSHDNHVCYLQHRLRGLYDTYHFTGLGTDVPRTNKKINNILDAINNSTIETKGLFDALIELKYERVTQEFFQFPGPFIKKIVTFLDNEGLKKVNRFYCISETVKKRKEYFPDGVSPKVVYHPSFLSGYKTGAYDYIFTVSRLDGPKRVDLLIKAMDYVKSDVKLKIAGTGPREKELKELAAGDNRIEFLGFVNNIDLLELYANALVVPFIPYDEDYGLITIEAFKSKKPIVTCVDSGGCNEFVKDNVTGFSVPPDPKAIGDKLDLLANDKVVAMRMGEEGHKRISGIDWCQVANNLLQTNFDGVKKAKKKVVVTSTFPIYPPMGGGQSRIFNLYKNLAVDFDIEIVSFTNHDQQSFDGKIAPGLKEKRFPKSNVHQEKEWQIEKKTGVPVTDVAMPQLSGYTPEYGEYLRKVCKNTDFVVVSHPYLYDEVSAAKGTFGLIYEAHNVEYDLKSGVLPEQNGNLLDEVYRVEKACCEKSSLIMTCSDKDASRLAELYGIELTKFIVVPNGVDVKNVSFVSMSERKENKKSLGLAEEYLVLFMGSWHPPNLQACREVFKMAEKLPDFKFLLLGSQCLAFEGQAMPDNIGLLGVVSEEEKNFIFSVVDIALNPMLSGSGTNLKMFDYMAAGIPIITTEFGARGINALNGESLLICSIDEMYTEISRLLKVEPVMINKITDRARSIVQNDFDWSRIVLKLNDTLKM